MSDGSLGPNFEHEEKLRLEDMTPERATSAEKIKPAEGERARGEKRKPVEAVPAKPSAKPHPLRHVKPIPQLRDEVTLKVEKIMEEGINEAYSRLSPVAQQEFKLKGEETALKIRELLKATHIKVKKILGLIFEWLKMLPGVNKFFLEQEAKIKTDKIIHLHKK